MFLNDAVLFVVAVYGIQLAFIAFGAEPSSLKFMNYAIPLKNRILIDEANKLQKTTVVNDRDLCAFMCLETEGCMSYNFGTLNSLNGECEIFSLDRLSSPGTISDKEGFVHVSVKNSCEDNPCENGGRCSPVRENRYLYQMEFTCNCSSTGLKGKTCSEAFTTFDFENGLSGWTRTGTAFNNQPTYGDNPTAREREPSAHQGDWWIGGFEDRPSSSHPAGAFQGDEPQGTLTSPVFSLEGHTLKYMIGGGCDMNAARAELLIEGQVVLQETGNCLETLTERAWDVRVYRGKKAQLRLVDASSIPWGHINFDYLTEI